MKFNRRSFLACLPAIPALLKVFPSAIQSSVPMPTVGFLNGIQIDRNLFDESFTQLAHNAFLTRQGYAANIFKKSRILSDAR